MNFLGAVHSAGDLLGTDEPPRARLLQRRIDREGEQLLQDVHHVDQREDQEDIRREKHVRLQTHQEFRQVT